MTNILFENVQFLSGASGATTKRTPAQRWTDIFNVKDYGAKGDGSTDDTAAIQAAINAMYASAQRSGIVFFPEGAYKVSDSGNGNAINLNNTNVPSFSTSGSIRGSGRTSTVIVGTLPNGFILCQSDINGGGPEEISDIGLTNSSTVIGSGSLMINNSSMRIFSCEFSGQINVLMPSNVFQVKIENCFGSPTGPDVTSGNAGTFGIAGDMCDISCWRTTANYQAAIQLSGVNPCTVSSCSNENSTVGLLAGMQTGWASACTVSGNVLTVGGNLGSLVSTQFFAGSEIFMKGLTTAADWGISPLDATRCTITETHNENPTRTGLGWAGTYTISRSATVSSPVPCIGRVQNTIASAVFHAVSSEACYFPIFVMSASSCHFAACGGSGAPNECPDAFGNTGFTSNSCFYIYDAQGCSFTACGANNNPYLASWYFDPNKNPVCSLRDCVGAKQQDSITGTTSKIDNGSGSAGTILTVNSLTQTGFVGVGMRAFVSGSQVAKVTGNHASDNTLTGAGGTGTYRVDTSQLVTGQAITIKSGEDWILPTTDAGKTGIQFYNSTSLNLPIGYTTGLSSLNPTFASLPGNVGSNNTIPVILGMERFITDGQKSGGGVATLGDIVQGGGSQKLLVWFNGTNWTCIGK